MYILLHTSSEYKNKASQRLQIKTFKTSKLEPNRRFGAVLILADKVKKATSEIQECVSKYDQYLI